MLGFLLITSVAVAPIQAGEPASVDTNASRQGIVETSTASVTPAALPKTAAVPDLPVAPEPEEQATPELEELRALEAATLGGEGEPSALRGALQRLGAGSPLRDQLGAALEALDDSSEAQPFVLAPITDLKRFDVATVRDRYDIPVEMQPLVEQYVRFFQGSGRRWFRRWMSRSHRYIPLMQPLLEANGMPRDLVYLAMIESGFNTQARSWAAAVGPWQFIPATGQRFGLKQDFWVDERRDPIKSTLAAGRYLKELHGQFGHWYLAWAGYNSGGGMVKRVITKTGTNDFWQMIAGKGFRNETKHYVPKLIACALVARHFEAFGFSPSEFEPEGPFEFETATLTEPVDLEILARAADTSLEALQELNPELKRWCTPPASEAAPYTLRLPKGSGARFAENFAKLPPREKLSFALHRVKRGDTLSAIALAYHSAPEAILRMNGLQSARALKLNSELIVPVPSARALASGKPDAFIERQSAQARRLGVVVRPQDEIPAGTPSARAAPSGTVKSEVIAGKTRVVYGVAPGDTLWSISQRFDVSLVALRGWNEALPPRGRSLKVGTAVTLWPGPKAEPSPSPAP